MVGQDEQPMVDKPRQSTDAPRASEVDVAPIDVILAKLNTGRDGLTAVEVRDRLAQYGPNELPENTPNPILQFLSYYWNPLSWAMEAAAILAIILGDYLDFGLIFALLTINALIGFVEEHSSGKAVEALKAALSPEAHCKRAGEWVTIPARELVPGDIVRVKGGDIIPADSKLLEGEPITVDMAALNGESLPSTKYPGNEVYSGATVKTGEIDLVVYATGSNTFFGKATQLVQGCNEPGHFQLVMKVIGYFCIIFICLWVGIEMIVQFGIRWVPCSGPGWGLGDCLVLNNLLVLIVGGIPIAMPCVLSVTMAIGAGQLAKKNAIVTRLTAVEELAGMNILCSDKTGTLTLNHLTLSTPEIWDPQFDNDTLMFHACLASSNPPQEAIDRAIFEGTPGVQERLQGFEHVKYIPFNPVSKKVTAHVVNQATGEDFWTCKGAPQVILAMDKNKDAIHDRVDTMITDYAGKGYRTLGVAHSLDGETWTMEGLIPLFDPPRHDTKETCRRAKELGISVKMITGDQIAIARETCRQLDLADDIELPAKIERYKEAKYQVQQDVLAAGGFAGVFPEHKYEIVKILQDAGYFVGMTGDGVNDAPALKKADIGIAVSDATDAARAAADIVLLTPGLGVIIDAIIGARKIFQRMHNYAMYAVTTTVRITLTFGLLTIIYNWYFNVLLTLIIALLNDGTILTISKDRVKPSPEPDHWDMPKLFGLALVFGGYLAGCSLILFSVARETDVFVKCSLPEINDDELRALMYLYVSTSGQAVIFVTRSHGWWFQSRPSNLLVCAFIVAQSASTCIAIFGFNGYPFDDRTDFYGCGWHWALVSWIWAVITFIPLDPLKFVTRWAIAWIFHPRASATAARRGVRRLRHPVYGNLKGDLATPLEAHTKANIAPPTLEEIEWPRPSLDVQRPSLDMQRNSVDTR